jgi:putative peptidoglycan lipid II flippase
MENSHDQPSFVRSTATVSAGTLTSRVLGMVKMSVLSGLFGASDANDAFVAAFKIPNMLRDMFAEGALSAAFIPVFTTRLKLVGRSDSFQTANVVMSFLLVTVGLLVLVGIGLAPEIVSLLAPGFSETPGKFELTVMLGRVMMPFLLVISIAALFMGMLNALGKFGTPAFAPAVLNIGMIACGFILCPILNPPILGMAIGVLIGGTGQCLIQLPQLMKSGFRLRFRLNLWDPDL